MISMQERNGDEVRAVVAQVLFFFVFYDVESWMVTFVGGHGSSWTN